MSFHIKHNKVVKKINLKKYLSAQELSHLIAGHFDLKEKIIGISDKSGNFFDL